MGCAVANAVLDIVSSPAVLTGVNERRERLEEGILAIGEPYGVFEQVRGMGLLIGCVLAEPWTGRARDFMQAAQDEGLFILVAGANVLRVAPSLIIPKDDVEQGLVRLQKAVAKVCEAKGQAAG